MLRVLRIPDFRLLWGSSLISSFGSWLLVLAIPAHVFLATSSLRDTGLALVAQYLPLLLLGPVAGVFADWWNRRRLMIATNLFCAGAVAVMLLGTSAERYWVLYVALIAESCGAVLYAPALQAHTPIVVGTGPLLSSANSLTSFSGGIVRLIGGPLGAILLTVYGISWLIRADALSYLLSAAAIYMTSRSGGEHASVKAAIRDAARDLIEGARVLCYQPTARALLPVTIIFLAANASLSSVLIPLGIQRLGGSDLTGFLLSCLGAGFLLGAPVIRAFLDRAQPRNLLAASLTATAGAYFLLFTSSSLATALPAAVAVGMFGSMSLVIPQTTMQRVIPNAILGRVSAVFLTGQAAANLIGALTGPFLAHAAGLTAVGAAASIVTLSAAALARLNVPRTPHQLRGRHLTGGCPSRASGRCGHRLPHGRLRSPADISMRRPGYRGHACLGAATVTPVTAATAGQAPTRLANEPPNSSSLVLTVLLSRLTRCGLDTAELVGINDGADRLDEAVGDVEFDHADYAPLGIVDNRAGLAVDPGRPNGGLAESRPAEQAGDQRNDALPPDHRFPDRLRLAAAVPVDDHVRRQHAEQRIHVAARRRLEESAGEFCAFRSPRRG